eukprot:6173304-Pleurochrysis_carterae.AAC.2
MSASAGGLRLASSVRSTMACSAPLFATVFAVASEALAMAPMAVLTATATCAGEGGLASRNAMSEARAPASMEAEAAARKASHRWASPMAPGSGLAVVAKWAAIRSGAPSSTRRDAACGDRRASWPTSAAPKEAVSGSPARSGIYLK